MKLNARLESVLDGHFRSRVFVYVLVVLLFTMGSLFGALAVNALTPDQKVELGEYLKTFFQGFNRGVPVSRVDVVRESLQLNVVRTTALIWLLSISVVGAPVILVIVFARGFALGFTVGLLVREMALAGAAFALVSILPQSFLMIPALVVVSVAGVSFSIYLFRGRINRRGYTGGQFAGFTTIAVLAGLVMAGAALVEGYVTPVLVELLARYLV
jgi:stage II sporulation protein M